MTRKQLLERLQQLQESGEDMNVPVGIRIPYRASDKRRTSGYKYTDEFLPLEYATSGVRLVKGVWYGELLTEMQEY